ncbi:MAG: hypothetical protein ACE14M_01455 [Terriglobales bacterium]
MGYVGTAATQVLFPGVPIPSDTHHPGSTTNPEAQTSFDSGLALLYGFNHDEAAER